MNNKSFEELKELVLEWADDKDLLHEENAEKQFMKFIEEVFEFKEAWDNLVFVKGMREPADKQGIRIQVDEKMVEDCKLEMGDIFVTLIILCEQLEINPVVCLEMAYEKISKRQGKTINGMFYKAEDLNND